MKAENDKFVAIHYTLKDDDGNLIDSSRDSQPLGYIQGNNYLLPKLEERINGCEEGETFSIVREATDGYGEYDPNALIEVPRENFETEAPVEIGMQFQAMTPYGAQIVTVKKVDEKTVTVDSNHALAGKRLHFDVEVIEVRDPSDEEKKLLNSNEGCGCGGDCSCGGDCGGDCSSGGCGGCSGCC